MYIGLHATYCYSCQILIEVEFSSQIFKRHLNIKFHESCPVGAEMFIVDGWMDGQTDITKRTVAFHNFVNKPTNPEPCFRFHMDSKVEQEAGIHVLTTNNYTALIHYLWQIATELFFNIKTNLYCTMKAAETV
jgi:hypothetical protein